MGGWAGWETRLGGRLGRVGGRARWETRPGGWVSTVGIMVHLCRPRNGSKGSPEPATPLTYCTVIPVDMPPLAFITHMGNIILRLLMITAETLFSPSTAVCVNLSPINLLQFRLRYRYSLCGIHVLCNIPRLVKCML